MNSISKNITLSTILIILVILILTSIVNYTVTINRIEQTITAKLQELSNHLQHSFSPPLYNLDKEAIFAIGQAYMTDENIVLLKIIELGYGKPIFDKHTVIEKNARIIYQEVPLFNGKEQIGLLEFGLSTKNFTQKLKTIFWNNLIIGVLLSLSLIFTIRFFVLKFLNKPFVAMEKWADQIAMGQYKTGYPGKPVKELSTMVAKFSAMADKVSSREFMLVESEEKHRILFENIPLKIYYKDLNSVYTSCNRNFADHIKINPEDIVGKSDFEFFPKTVAERFKLEDKEIIEQAKVLEIEEESTHNGEKHWHQKIKTPIKNNKGTVIGIIGVARDITEHKKAEEEKNKAHEHAARQEQHAFVGQVAGKLAHDFNNILGVIMGNAELSMLDCKDKKIKETLELIFEQTIRGRNLTKNLVAFAKDQEPKRELFNINEKADLILNLLKKDLEGISVIQDKEPNIKDLLADPGMIEHALVNLLQNSIHALSKNENPGIITRTYCKDDNIFIEIEDNGCGIPEDQLKNIYDHSFSLKGNKDVARLYKTEIKGTGYGMANVKKYIELHNGSIVVESKLNIGTKIIITLPIINKEITKVDKVELIKAKVYFNKSILLVEDEIAISNVQHQTLIKDPCNHKVDTAFNGQDAIDLFNTNEYDFVSLDYILPGKINGMDVYNHIREKNKTIPILFVSGNIEFLESIKKLKQNDTNLDHIAKPCRNEKYLDSINKLLEPIVSV